MNPNSLRCPSYCPGEGSYSAGLLLNIFLVIIADGIVGLIYDIAKSVSYAPTGGFESGFHLYLPPIVMLFWLYPKSVKCPSY